MKFTLLYKLFKIPTNLEELLDNAKREGEKKIHILGDYSTNMAYPGGGFHSVDVSINVRYFHGKEIREISAYRTSSKSPGYKADLRIKDIKERIEKSGLEVKTIRNNRRIRNN
jgi:hypothetical protein